MNNSHHLIAYNIATLPITQNCMRNNGIKELSNILLVTAKAV
jgi:hypothetical protein